uniref:ATP synthase F0 subunit 6 n=1 Tax=Metathelazia capsulata TaxID=2964486 RepID=UPI002E775B57|nr:ATP synthase F0 subunit 6 [Metathelazia capsulata]WPS93536.1 ATP synthase F0 subunit 6 [Metathelazia capsulata]
MSFCFWTFFMIFIFYFQFCKFMSKDYFRFFLESSIISNFEHSGVQSVFFFKFVLFFLFSFWFSGLVFPLFSPWASLGFLFLLTTFSWLGVRFFTLLCNGFLIMFEEHEWNWFSSIVMFFAHVLSYLMSGVALFMRITIIFLIGHFLMFSVSSLDFFYSFFFMLFVFVMEVFFALLQSYIFLTLICMFLLNMI